MASAASERDNFRTVVYGLGGTATFAFLAWVATSVNGMSDRLTTIEVTMRENRAERIQSIEDLRDRVSRIEDGLEARAYPSQR